MTGQAPSSSADRVIVVDGAHNLRDLGGLTTADGHEVRRGRIFRSDFPGFARIDGDQTVQQLGLRSVVDLRRGSEEAEEAVLWERHGVRAARHPLRAGSEDSWHARYQAYLDQAPEPVVATLRVLMDPAQQPALFHCAAGKDRTGTIAALLLKVLGVPDEQVVADYVLTVDTLEASMARLQAIGVYAEMLASSSVDDQVPRAKHMAGFLTWLEETGGAERWMLEHGLTADEVARFREAMLETA